MTAILTLVVGMAVGFLMQRSRFCMLAPLRNFVLTRDWRGFRGMLALFGSAYLLYSVAVYFGWVEWAAASLSPGLVPRLNIVGCAGAGLGLVSLAAGSCPARQHIIAAQGDRDALLYLLGFYLGILLYPPLTARLLASLL
jgi:hypothetical protein